MARESRARTGFLLVLGILGTLPGCGPRPPPELRVGLILPLTGSLQSLAEFGVQGAQLAVKEIEKAGGLSVDGRRCTVELVVRDGGMSPETAVAVAQELINTERVAALVGPPLSEQAIPVARLASQAGVPMVVQLATHPDVTRGVSLVFRICFVDTFQGRVLAQFAREDLGALRAAVLFEKTSPFPRTIAQVFREQFEAAGGEVVLFDSFTTGEQDFHEALRRVAASTAQVLLLPNYRSDLLAIGLAIHEVGLDVQILGCDTMRFAAVEDTRLYDGAYVTAHFASDSPAPAARAFSQAFQQEYRRTPSASAALTYDAISLLLHVARTQKSTDPKAIAQGLASIREYQGVTGTMRYDDSPDPAKSVIIAAIRDGTVTFHAQVDP